MKRSTEQSLFITVFLCLLSVLIVVFLDVYGFLNNQMACGIIIGVGLTNLFHWIMNPSTIKRSIDEDTDH